MIMRGITKATPMLNINSNYRKATDGSNPEPSNKIPPRCANY